MKTFTLLNGVEVEIDTWTTATKQLFQRTFSDQDALGLQKAIFPTIVRIGNEKPTLEHLTEKMLLTDFDHLLIMGRTISFSEMPKVPVKVAWKNKQGKSQEYIHHILFDEQSLNAHYSKKVLEVSENRLYKKNPKAKYYDLFGCKAIKGVTFGHEFLEIDKDENVELVLFENVQWEYTEEQISTLQDYVLDEGIEPLQATETIKPIYESYDQMLLDSTYSVKLSDGRVVSLEKCNYKMEQSYKIKNATDVDMLRKRNPKVDGVPTTFNMGFSAGQIEYLLTEVTAHEGWVDTSAQLEVNPFTRKKETQTIDMLRQAGFFLPSRVR